MMLRTRTLALASLLLAPLAPSLLFAAPQDDAVAPAVTTEAKAPPFLWRIEGDGVAAYLYGTIHLPDDRVLALPPAVESAFAWSDSFYAEIDATPASEMQVQSAAILGGGERLDSLVGDATWTRVEARFAKAQLPALFTDGMKGMKPWAVNAMMPMLDYVPDLMAGKAPLDKMLYQRARKLSKDVGGLETVDEQIAVFEAFDQAQQIQMLRESLDLLDRYDAEGRNVMQETVRAWLSGDEELLMTLLDDGFGTDPLLRDRAEDELLWKRNVRLADRIAGRMKAEPTKHPFFAVGALHMLDAPKPPSKTDGTPGETPAQAKKRSKKLGIVSLLRAKGYRVERVTGALQETGAGR